MYLRLNAEKCCLQNPDGDEESTFLGTARVLKLLTRAENDK